LIQSSIIIRSKNEEDSIGKTLESLLNQDADHPPEIILVDSGSTDKTLDIAGAYNVKICSILPEEFTYGYALNFGIRESAGDIICLLSAHCIPTSGQWLSELIRPIKDGSAHATFGRQVPVKGMNPFEEVSLNKHFPANDKKSGRVPFSNANCAFVRKMWQEMAFDETLPAWEDYLWYIHLKDRYLFQYCPEAAVSHTHPFSFRSIVQRTYNDGRAFRIIRDKYGIDLFNSLYPGLKAKLRMLVNDVITHVTFFTEKGYKKYIPLIPVVRAYSYFIYWKGYRSVR
jgi:glycosyltransferase involved in cell wall biosynthesis